MTTYYGTSGNDRYGYFDATEPLLAYGYGGADTLLSGLDNDTLIGGTGDDYLGGWFGNDLLEGGVGNDLLEGGVDNDTLKGGAGADIFTVGANFTDVSIDTASVDTIADFRQNQGDKIWVLGSLSDYSIDQTQNISGRRAFDTAIYYQDNLIGVVRDTTQVSLLEDILFIQGGTQGDDVLIGEAGADSYSGGFGNDTIYGGAGDDSLYGAYQFTNGDDYGKDVMYGGDGNDSLYGGLGNDTLTGGDGADTFNFNVKGYLPFDFSSLDIITDFSHDQGDKIEVLGSLSDYSIDQTQNISGGSGLDTAIYYQYYLTAIVQDTTQISLSSDFIFTSGTT